MKLPVNITANRHRRIDMLNIALLEQNFARLVAKIFHLCLCQRLAPLELRDVPA